MTRVAPLLTIAIACSLAVQGWAQHIKVEDAWQPIGCSDVGGLLGERLGVWRDGRLGYMLDAEDGYLLAGFESGPGVHPWQGEHVGKWLHAATLAHQQTQNKKLSETLRSVVIRLLATQETNGYLGTYGADYTFMARPENVTVTDVADDISPPKTNRVRPRGGWDTWTLRYNLYGLLTYERFHADPRIAEACQRMADLLIETYGEGKYNLTHYGTRKGISATTLLESIVMLYERTRERRYLDFAVHIVAMSEANPGLRLMGTMLDNGSVVGPGEGKAYQLMANLLGYIRLFQCTGEQKYLTTAINGWREIRERHLIATGGPWSRKMSYNGNRECFARPADFDPWEVSVETCSTTTWVQLCLHLFLLTGQAEYAEEAETAIFNSLLAAQHPEGIDWCYFTTANQSTRSYRPNITCCASSGPRALEMFSHYLIGEVDGGISFASLVPCCAVLPDSLGGARIKVKGDYPRSPRAQIQFAETRDEEFAVEFRPPANSRLSSVRVNGQDVALRKNGRGFLQIHRAWKTGDEITIEFEYLLKSHLETPEGGQSWVAFTYGPWALAQTIDRGDSRNPLEGPFAEKDISTESASHWLEGYKSRDTSEPRFRIKNTEIILGPYYSSGSRETGQRTYFKTGHIPRGS